MIIIKSPACSHYCDVCRKRTDQMRDLDIGCYQLSICKECLEELRDVAHCTIQMMEKPMESGKEQG